MHNRNIPPLSYVLIVVVLLLAVWKIPPWELLFDNEETVSANESVSPHPPVIMEALEKELITLEEQDEIECMAINTYHEARDQSVAGQLAVMHVVLNRVASPKFPDSICGVVTQGPTYVNWLGNTWPVRDQCQFSWYCDGMSDTAEDVESYKKIKKLADQVVTTETFDITEGSTYYHADYVKPNWRKQFRRVVKIDTHIFYAP